MDTADESIRKTKESFERRLTERNFYNKQTHDDKHLSMILENLKITSGMSILDLGTGNGYVAFSLARKYPMCHITGLDIVTLALKRNRKRALTENLNNLEFISYDGKHFPFQKGEFDMVVSRYALHHFPDIEGCFFQVSDVLKPGGIFFISDPTPIQSDDTDFINDYMRLFNDGHIKYYTKEEFESIGKIFNLKLENNFETMITFPKEKSLAVGFDKLFAKQSEKLKKAYCAHLDDEEIWMTHPVNNMTFRSVK